MIEREAWPATLTLDHIALRPIRRRDEAEWARVRRQNHAWLSPWEGTAPPGSDPAPGFVSFAASMLREARAGRAFPWMLTYDGALIGQVTVSSITYGSARTCSIGYWISRDMAGRGIMPTAVALAADHCWQRAKLHRVEIVIRPENRPSLRVVEKLGFRDEGYRLRYLHIAGRWADHRCFALTSEEVPDGLLNRWLASRGSGGITVV